MGIFASCFLFVCYYLSVWLCLFICLFACLFLTLYSFSLAFISLISKMCLTKMIV
jgi:hypothetical protein